VTTLIDDRREASLMAMACINPGTVEKFRGATSSPRGLIEARHDAARRGRIEAPERIESKMKTSQGTSHAAARLVLALALAASSAGCGSVAAYERGKLAHPTMSPSDASSVAREHVYSIQEGAMGGSVGVASGCGCN
jgi:hypothetical protein